MNESPDGFTRCPTGAAMLVRSPTELRALSSRAARKLAVGASDGLRAVRDELETFS